MAGVTNATWGRIVMPTFPRPTRSRKHGPAVRRAQPSAVLWPSEVRPRRRSSNDRQHDTTAVPAKELNVRDQPPMSPPSPTCCTRTAASRRRPSSRRSANAKADAYDEAAADRLAFWAKQADG